MPPTPLRPSVDDASAMWQDVDDQRKELWADLNFALGLCSMIDRTSEGSTMYEALTRAIAATEIMLEVELNVYADLVEKADKAWQEIGQTQQECAFTA